MAGIGAGVTSKALGEAIFGQPKLKTVWGNDALARLQTDPDKYPSLLTDLMASGKKTGASYAAALDLGLPEATRIQADDIFNYGNLIKSGMAYNPAGGFDEYLGSTIGGPNGLRSLIPDLYGAGNNAVSNKALMAGINGTTNTAYNTRAGLSQLGSSLAPILNTIYGGVAPAASMLANNRLANIGSTVGLMRERAGIPDRLANRALLPFQAEANMLGEQFGLAGQLADVTKANIQGNRLDTNKWANLMGATGEATDSAVDTGIDVAQMALSAYTGGMMGGGMGGGSATPQGYQAPQNFGYFQPQTGGYGAQTFGPSTYGPPPQYGMLGPGSLGGYNYAPAPYTGPYGNGYNESNYWGMGL